MRLSSMSPIEFIYFKYLLFTFLGYIIYNIRVYGDEIQTKLLKVKNVYQDEGIYIYIYIYIVHSEYIQDIYVKSLWICSVSYKAMIYFL